MLAALAAEDVLAADETPVNVPARRPSRPGARGPRRGGPGGESREEDKAAAGAPHVLVVTTPDGRLRFLLALASRRKASVAGGIPAGFAGHLMTDGYTGYQHLLAPA